jgi:hypothetical protein
MVSSGFFFGSSCESFNLSLGWVDVVLLEVGLDSSGEFSFRDLTVSVGVNLFEDSIGLFHGDTRSFFSSDLDGGGGGDEGDEGEFHFELFVFLFVIIVLITLA